MREHIRSNVEEHSTYTIEECADFIKDMKNKAIISKSLKILASRIVELTQFIDQDYEGTTMVKGGIIPMATRYSFLLHGVFSSEQTPVCCICGERKVSVYNNIFREHCTHKDCLKAFKVEKQKATNLERYGDTCSLRNEKVKEKAKQTNLERYGVENAIQNKEVKAKATATMVERFGVECSLASDEVKEKVKQTNMERYGVENALSSMLVQEKVKQTNMERYGVENVGASPEVRAKVEATNLERIGVINPFMSDEIKGRIKANNLEQYGVEYSLQRPDIRTRIEATNMERYGYKTPLLSPVIQQRIKATNMEVYGDESPSKTDAVKNRIKTTNLERYGKPWSLMNEDIQKRAKDRIMEIYGVENVSQSDVIKSLKEITSMNNWGVPNPTMRHIKVDALDILRDKEQLEALYLANGGPRSAAILGCTGTTIYYWLKEHGIERESQASSLERDIQSFLDTLGITYTTNDRTIIGPKELDIVIPSHNIAIEVNGAYWHSSKFKSDSMYHLNKTRACEAAGYRLIHIFDDEWYDREDQMKRKLASILGIREERVMARKTRVVKVASKDSSAFYEENHVQGGYHSKQNYALFLGDEMVACMSFKMNYGYMDLVRYATSKNVVGGFTKLLKAFLRDNPEVEEVVSFADIRYSDGNLYASNGWELVSQTKPNYYYVVDGMRFKKQNFRKKKLEVLLGDLYDPSMSERQIMEALDIPRVYDCGLMKFKLTRDKIGL